MKIMSWRNVLTIALALGLGAALLYTSQRVQTASDSLETIEAQIQQEKERIAVLEAEWEFLNAPQRLEKMAKEYYGVDKPSVSNMIGGMQNIPFPAPIETTPVNGQAGAYDASTLSNEVLQP